MTLKFELPLPDGLIVQLLAAFRSACSHAQQPLTDAQLRAIRLVLRRIHDGATLADLCSDPDSDASQLQDPEHFHPDDHDPEYSGPQAARAAAFGRPRPPHPEAIPYRDPGDSPCL